MVPSFCILISTLTAPLTLDAAYSAALERSDALKIALGSVDLAYGPGLGAAGGGGLLSGYTLMGPTAEFDAAAYQQNLPVTTGLLSNGTGTVTVNLPIFRRGIFAAIRSGQFELESARAQVRRTRQQVFLDVVTAFINVLRERDLQVEAANTVKRAQSQLENIAVKLQAGGALRTAQLQASLDLGRAQVQATQDEQDLHTQEFIFERIVGSLPPAEMVLSPLPAIPGQRESRDIVQQRADIDALHRLVQAGKEQVDMAYAAYWPKLDLAVVYQRWLQAIPIGPPYTVNNFDFYRATATVSVPLLQGGTAYLNVLNQVAQLEQAEAVEAQARKQATQDVETAWAVLHGAEQTAIVAQKEENDARDNYELLSVHFKLRAVTFLEVTTAQAALNDAERLRVGSRYDRELAVYKLLFAIGTLPD
jgi:outer membrane protein